MRAQAFDKSFKGNVRIIVDNSLGMQRTEIL